MQLTRADHSRGRRRHRNTAHHLCLDGNSGNFSDATLPQPELHGAPGSCLDFGEPDAYGHQLRRAFEVDHDCDRRRGIGSDGESHRQSVSGSPDRPALSTLRP